MLLCFCSQIMLKTFSPLNSCVYVAFGDSCIYDHGSVLPTWMHLYQGKKYEKKHIYVPYVK